MTPFETIYAAFYSMITDDYYLALSEEETAADLEGLLRISYPLFEFPRKPLTINGSSFDTSLDVEEVNILATEMVKVWLGRQINSIEVLRQKVGGADFRVTSQAQHLNRLLAWKQEMEHSSMHLQRLYGRRYGIGGGSTFDQLVGKRGRS